MNQNTFVQSNKISKDGKAHTRSVFKGLQLLYPNDQIGAFFFPESGITVAFSRSENVTAFAFAQCHILENKARKWTGLYHVACKLDKGEMQILRNAYFYDILTQLMSSSNVAYFFDGKSWREAQSWIDWNEESGDFE